MSECRCKKCVLGIVIGVVVLAVVLCFVFCKRGSEQAQEGSDSNGLTGEVQNQQGEAMDKLVIEDLTEGTGTQAEAGKVVSVHYTGTLTDGTKFDSSLDRGVPFSFRLGTSQVIAGWDQGIQGMKVGGKRKLTIPPSLGYGANAVGPIPANSTLVFEVELLDVK